MDYDSGQLETETCLEYDQGTLILRGWSKNPWKMCFEFNPFRPDARSNCLRCDALHYANVAMQLSQKAWNYRDAANLSKKIQWRKTEIHPPRPEQQAAIDAWTKRKRGVIVMPTGTGKTEVALHLMAINPCAYSGRRSCAGFDVPVASANPGSV